jgi:hypothetical protein
MAGNYTNTLAAEADSTLKGKKIWLYRLFINGY